MRQTFVSALLSTAVFADWTWVNPPTWPFEKLDNDEGFSEDDSYGWS